MKDYLTIGEIAKLMNISTHQVRYFEEKGILYPEEVGENGYRKYGINSVYRIAHILYLREFNISVKDIKKCFDEYTQLDYYDLLNEKIKEIDSEIIRLQKLKQQTENVVECIGRASSESSNVLIKQYPARIMNNFCTMNYHKRLTAKDVYKYFSGVSNLHKIDIMMYFDNGKYSIGYEVEDFSKKDCLTISEGKYLTNTIAVREENEIDEAIERVMSYAKKHKLKLEKKLLIRENSKLSITQNKERYFDIEVRIID